MGESASFNLETEGGIQLLFQWRFNGVDLPGSTDSNLTVNNVALSDLGLYTIVVRDGADEIATEPAVLKLARWTELVHFGSSGSLPRDPNGPSWVPLLATRLGIESRNFAVGRADLADLSLQVDRYLSANQPDIHTLLSFGPGGLIGEWLFDRSIDTEAELSELVSEWSKNISRLAEVGGRTFLMPTIKVPAFVPRASDMFPHITNQLAVEMNRMLIEEVSRLRQTYDLTIFHPDKYHFYQTVWAAPGEFGFTDLVNSAKDSPGNDDEFFWWDGIHITAAAQRVLSAEIYGLVAPPSVRLEPVLSNPDGTLSIRWSGGGAPFLIQRRADLAADIWEHFGGATENREVTVSIGDPHAFFRVLQLGQ